MDIEKLARKDVQRLTPYLSARKLGGQGEIWLNANESPFDNLYSVCGAGLNRYSECQPASLILAYAHYAHVQKEKVLTSRGADESIDLLIRTFCEPGHDHILFCPPTYGMYEVSANVAGVACKKVPLTQQWQLDLPNIEKNLQDVKLVFICNPNNPTGNRIKEEDIKTLLEMTHDKALVVIDEAYIDFCPEASFSACLPHYPNLVILRTLSKAFALAGLRCGFTLADPKIIALMLNIIAPYPVPSPVIDIACQALSKEGIFRMKEQVNLINTQRNLLESALSKLPGFKVFNGSANFILFKCPRPEALFSTLWDNGIILRKSSIEGCIRISVGLYDECEKTLQLMCDKGISPSNLLRSHP